MFDDIMLWIAIIAIVCSLIGGWFRFLDFIRDVIEVVLYHRSQ